MKPFKRTLALALGLAGLLAGLAIGAAPSPAADHLEAPLAQLDGRTDLNDLYVFESPDNPDHTVLIMTVNPLAGIASPTTFDEDALYRFAIDTDADGKRNRSIVVRFEEPADDGAQAFRVSGAGGSGSGTTGEIIDLGSSGHAVAGTFDDPFFFDLQAFQDQVKAAGGERTFCDDEAADFLAGTNVSAIVLEVPTNRLVPNGETALGVWAETWNDGRLDRVGRPGIATVLIDDGSEDGFNSRSPEKDLETFGPQVEANLLALSGLDGSGYTEEEARGITELLLPDVLTYDTAEAAEYLNGRGLTDDVIDLSLTVVTGGLGANESPVLTSDCVDGNDVDFLDEFPYLAQAHEL
ncbi:MAG: DUF4331 family protein [Actinomycetota bacterium]